MKIVTIIGARPQLPKAAVVSRALQQVPGVEEVVVDTGQHYSYEMAGLLIEQLGMAPPSYNLGIGSGTHGHQTGVALERIESVLQKERPDRVLVYGDTNSTLAGALAAAKLAVPVAHVEAGLRSFDRGMPEEINRVVTDHLADILFAPTTDAVRNLRAEGIAHDTIHQVGDVMYDAALLVARQLPDHRGILSTFGVGRGDYILATIHRAANTDAPDRLHAIFSALTEVAGEIPVVMPLHPRTRAALERYGKLQELTEGIRLSGPVGYVEMMTLEAHASVVVTDSGGVQKEAFFFEVPCVTLRETTEWTELVSSGWNRLVPPSDARTIRDEIVGAIGSCGEPIRPYGDGDAAVRIAEILGGARAMPEPE